jgi:hypothetical protein
VTAEGGTAVSADPDKRAVSAAPLWLPVLIALAVVTALLAVVVGASPSAWALLGAGRGLVPEAYYGMSGFLLVLATTLGQAVGWAGGSALLLHVLTLAGIRASWPTARLAMTVVYLGLATLPMALFHLVAGGWLLGLPRVGLAEWLRDQHPDAYWLLISAHPVIDLSVVPLGVLFLWVLWGTGERVRHSFGLQTLGWLALLGSSLAIALSLAIHSTLVHIRL